MRLIELNGFVRGNYLDCGACEWFRKRLGSLLKARLRTIKRERHHIWLLPMLVIERIPTAHYEEEKVKIQERCSHTMINLAIMWDGKLFQWFASETIFIWFATFDCKPLQSKLGTKYERFNVFPIFLYLCSDALSTFPSPVPFNSLLRSCTFFQPCGNHSLIMLEGASPANQ